MIKRQQIIVIFKNITSLFNLLKWIKLIVFLFFYQVVMDMVTTPITPSTTDMGTGTVTDMGTGMDLDNTDMGTDMATFGRALF